jgi:AcrR family transcriptional regulator
VTTRRAAARSRGRRIVPADQDGRARIIAAAIRSFSEAGYDGTTTAGVAREAGVTQPLVHHHFRSKEGLWHEAMDALFLDVRPLIPAPAETSPPEQLMVFVERFVRFVATHPQVTRVIAREGAASTPRLTYLIDRYLRAPFQQVVAAVRAGQRAGFIAPEVKPELVLFLVLGAGSHLFDVTALAQQSVGIDATTARTRDDMVVLLRTLLRDGLLSHGPAVARSRRS